MPARPARQGLIPVALVMLAAVAVAAAGAAPAHARPGARPLRDEAATAAAAEAMFTRLNAARAANGLTPYRSSPLLAGIAAGHAREVAEHNHYSHTGLDGRSAKQRMADGGYGAGHAGVRTSENFVARSTVEEAFDWLMSDKDHRPNMLDAKFREVGVGVAPTRFGFVWVLDFGTYDGVDAVLAAVEASPTAVIASPAPALVGARTVVTSSTSLTSTERLTTTTSVTVSTLTTGSVGAATTVATTTVAAGSVTATVAASDTAGPDGAAAASTSVPTPASRPPGTTLGSASLAIGALLGLLVVIGLLALASSRRGTGRSR